MVQSFYDLVHSLQRGQSPIAQRLDSVMGNAAYSPIGEHLVFPLLLGREMEEGAKVRERLYCSTAGMLISKR